MRFVTEGENNFMIFHAVPALCKWTQASTLFLEEPISRPLSVK